MWQEYVCVTLTQTDSAGRVRIVALPFVQVGAAELLTGHAHPEHMFPLAPALQDLAIWTAARVH